MVTRLGHGEVDEIPARVARGRPGARSYRSVFKYDPNKFKHPSAAWFEMFKHEFGMTDDDFRERRPGGDERSCSTTRAR